MNLKDKLKHFFKRFKSEVEGDDIFERGPDQFPIPDPEPDPEPKPDPAQL